MKILSTIVIACLVAGVSFASEVQWGHNYEDALQEAKQNKKLVIVDVYTDWCGWCKKLDKEVYSDKDVQQKLTANFVSVKINPEKNAKNAQLAESFGVRGYPHVVVMDAGGKKVGELKGFVPAAKFVDFLQSAMEKAAAK